jgi:energy-coupling factor transport system ATP-binding protein
LTNGRIQPLSASEQQIPTQISRRTPDGSDPPLVTVKNLEFSYGNRKVIDNVTLGLQRGEIVGLMGSNGSGKTTLLGLLGGLLAPDSGIISFNNSPLGRMNAKEIAHQISTVFQNPNHQIFEKTVWNEQILTLKALELDTSDMFEHCQITLERAGLAGLHERNPFSLSHGQKRRLNVSSIIVHSPKVLLLDEPFIGQDVDGREFIKETVMETVERGGTALIVTHDSRFVLDYCSRAVFMENGSILLDGSPSSIFERLENIGYREYADLGVQP